MLLIPLLAVRFSIFPLGIQDPFAQLIAFQCLLYYATCFNVVHVANTSGTNKFR